MNPDGDAARRAPRSPAEVFRVFNRLALQGFGGVLAVTQHHLVERERWLDEREFVDALTLAQMLPGPNVVNLALMLGDRWFGWRGAAAALAGMLATPLLIVLALAALATGFVDQPRVAGALRGMGVASAGLVAGTALRLLPALARNPLPRPIAAAAVAATAGALVVARLPLAIVLLGIGGASVAMAYRWRARGA